MPESFKSCFELAMHFPVCPIVKMASETVIRPIVRFQHVLCLTACTVFDILLALKRVLSLLQG